jgi:hypothetical protein
MRLKISPYVEMTKFLIIDAIKDFSLRRNDKIFNY